MQELQQSFAAVQRMRDENQARFDDLQQAVESHRRTEVNGAARVEVIDNGCGIKSADLSRLFDPFFSTRATSGGSGLGLSVAHGIITAHEGRIWAESELDKGTRIVMELALLA